jgi:tetratricopeptide (TPR) repeat protein
MNNPLPPSPLTFRQLLQQLDDSPDLLLPTPIDSAQGSALFDEARLLIVDSLAVGEIERATQAVTVAWSLADRWKVAEAQALAHWCNGLLLINRQVRSSLAHFERARAYFQQEGRLEEVGRLSIGCASQLNLLGRTAEAEAAIRQAMSHLAANPNYRDWPVIYLNLAYILGQQGNYPEMLAVARQAEETSLTFATKLTERAAYYQALRAQALINQGYAALALGEFAHAEAALQAAYNLAIDLSMPEIAGRAALNLGRLAIFQNQLFAALHRLAQARRHFQSAQIELDLATVALEEASLNERLLMPRPARRAALQAAQAFGEAGIVAESLEATLLAVRLSLALGEPKKAATYLEQARQAGQAAPPVLMALLAVYRSHPRLQRTSAAQQAALAVVTHAGTTLQGFGAVVEALEAALIGARLAMLLDVRDGEQRYRWLATQAQVQGLPALQRQALLEWADHAEPMAAIQLLRQAADLAASERRQMPGEELKAHLLTGHAALYTRLIELQLQQKQEGAALQTLFAAKGELWVELTAPFAASEVQADWVQAKMVYQHWQAELREAQEPEYVALCQEKLREAEANLLMVARLQTRRRPLQPLPGLAALQEQLPADALVLEYLVGENEIWLCCFTATIEPCWLPVGKRSEVQTLLGRLSLLLVTLQSCPSVDQRRQMAQSQQAAVYQLCGQLYQQLLAALSLHHPALLQQARTLLIVPDRYLFETPWSALHDGTKYLGERYELRLLPSSVLLALAPVAAKRPDGAQTASPCILGYAGQPPLLHLAAELAVVQACLPNARLINPARTSDFAWAVAPSLLHIAAHGRINRQTPLLSQWELADGPLLLADALNVALHGTTLLTLSGCETGTTPEQGGVLLALAGAFLCAGAQTVLASLWPVDDESTQRLMTALYAALQQGMPLAQALPQAQHQLRQAGFAHPFYCAAFQPLSRSL